MWVLPRKTPGSPERVQALAVSTCLPRSIRVRPPGVQLVSPAHAVPTPRVPASAPCNLLLKPSTRSPIVAYFLPQFRSVHPAVRLQGQFSDELPHVFRLLPSQINPISRSLQGSSYVVAHRLVTAACSKSGGACLLAHPIVLGRTAIARRNAVGFWEVLSLPSENSFVLSATQGGDPSPRQPASMGCPALLQAL